MRNGYVMDIQTQRNRKFLLDKIKCHYLSIGFLYVQTILLAITTLALSVLTGPILKFFFEGPDKRTVDSVMDPEVLKIFSLLGIEFTEEITNLVFSYLPVVIIILAATRFILQASTFSGWEKISETITKKLRDQLSGSFIHLNPEIKNSTQSKHVESSLTTVITTELLTIKTFITRLLGGIPKETLLTVCLTSALLIISWKLTLIYILVLIPLAGLLKKISKKIKRRARRAFDRRNELAEWIQQRLKGIETIKHYKSEKSESVDMKVFSESLLTRQIKQARASARTSPSSEFLTIIGFALIIYYSSYYRSELGLSSSAIMSYFSVLGFLSQSINKLSKYTNIYSTGKAALTKIDDTLMYQEKNYLKEVKQLFELKPENDKAIEISDLEFTYPGYTKPLIDIKSLIFEYGKIYAITGKSGAGKSTFVNLVLGCLKQNRGEISLFPTKGGETGITYMPQILEGSYLSLGRLVAYPNDTFDTEEVQRAISKAQLSDVLKSKNLTLNTELGFGSTTLSGGEWQRLNLARIFYQKGPIIIGDEFTSALDPSTEAEIIKEMKTLANNGKCIITIAHRPSVIDACDVSFSM